MRRFAPYLLLFLGVFLVALSILVRFVVAPKAVKIPLEVPSKHTQILASGSRFSFFDATLGRNVLINVWITRTVLGDVQAGTNDVAVYDESLCLTRVSGNQQIGCVPKGNPRLITNSTDRIAFDRTSALPVSGDKYGANVNGDTSIVHTGLGYTFPIDTKKKSYPFFDTVVGKSFPMDYVRETSLEGLTVYQFEQTIRNQPAYTNNTFPSLYSNKRTVWIEPTTGVIVKGQEQLRQVLTGRETLSPASRIVEPKLAGVLALGGTLTFTPDTVKAQAQLAKDNLSKIRLVRLWLPLICLVLGALALAGFFWLWYRGRRRTPGAHARPDEPTAPQPVVPSGQPSSQT